MEYLLELAEAEEIVQCDSRRRSEEINIGARLADIHEKMSKKYNISRSAVRCNFLNFFAHIFSLFQTYTRFIPRRWNTSEGQRHVNTIPVKMLRPENDAHSKHADAQLVFSIRRDFDELASILGADNCWVMSNFLVVN